MNGRPSVVRLETPEGRPNVTPLVDVALVLLVVFMVVAPMLGGRGDVSLPRTSHPGSLPAEERELAVSMRWPDGTTYVAGAWLPLPALRERLARERAGGPRRVVVRADERLSFADVRSLLRTIRAAGYDGASLAAARRTDGR